MRGQGSELHKSGDDLFPPEPIHRLTKPVERFMHVEAASGVVLLVATLMAIGLANSPVAEGIEHFWHTPLAVSVGSFEFRISLAHFINDGLMAVFFFVVGMEVKRELVLGELRDARRAALPIAAALGGMIVPAGVYLALQWGRPGARGWGIPMATDIAFVVGCLSVMGSRVPHGLRVMMLALAIADDIGAILVIAFGYSDGLSWSWLLAGLAGLGVVFGLMRLGVRSSLIYIMTATIVWFAFHESGVHATIAGVILGAMVPARSYLPRSLASRAVPLIERLARDDEDDAHSQLERIHRLRLAVKEMVSPVEYLIHGLHPWVSFLIMPVFALANAGVAVQIAHISSSISVAVMLGLLIGKTIGIVLVSWLAVKSGLARLPNGVSGKHLLAGGLLGGIGFTMSLFIASLALNAEQLAQAKVGILIGSAVCAAAGLLVLKTCPQCVEVRSP